MKKVAIAPWNETAIAFLLIEVYKPPMWACVVGYVFIGVCWGLYAILSHIQFKKRKEEEKLDEEIEEAINNLKTK